MTLAKLRSVVKVINDLKKHGKKAKNKNKKTPIKRSKSLPDTKSPKRVIKKAVAKKSAKVVKRSGALKLKNKNSKSVLKKRKMTDRSKSKPQKSKK
jgi:hypothetical protein